MHRETEVLAAAAETCAILQPNPDWALQSCCCERPGGCIHSALPVAIPDLPLHVAAVAEVPFHSRPHNRTQASLCRGREVEELESVWLEMEQGREAVDPSISQDPTSIHFKHQHGLGRWEFLH